MIHVDDLTLDQLHAQVDSGACVLARWLLEENDYGSDWPLLERHVRERVADTVIGARLLRSAPERFDEAVGAGTTRAADEA